MIRNIPKGVTAATGLLHSATLATKRYAGATPPHTPSERSRGDYASQRHPCMPRLFMGI